MNLIDTLRIQAHANRLINLRLHRAMAMLRRAAGGRSCPLPA